MSIFKQVFKIKRKLTLGEQIEVAKGHAYEALGMFDEAYKKLDGANEILSQAAEEAERQMVESSRHFERTTDEIRMNKAVQERLKAFTL
ncbi:hypothetical protein MKY96_32765 [Paenibacillus sp. FSL R7-0302]|uniref:hypothetical protein n=1 Tax=Paenibacillus sp. FSL R7-0302 TaxID=2921681 RepID=UPI0030FB61E2